jgi:hypothetical protein
MLRLRMLRPRTPSDAHPLSAYAHAASLAAHPPRRTQATSRSDQSENPRKIAPSHHFLTTHKRALRGRNPPRDSRKQRRRKPSARIQPWGMTREPIAGVMPPAMHCKTKAGPVSRASVHASKNPGVRVSAPHTPWNNPKTYDTGGTQTRHQPGHPAKMTRSQFGNHERHQFGI